MSAQNFCDTILDKFANMDLCNMHIRVNQVRAFVEYQKWKLNNKYE